MKKEVDVKAGCVRPAPNVLVSCRDENGRNNALAVGFTANVSIDPPMIMVGIVPDHYSHGLESNQVNS